MKEEINYKKILGIVVVAILLYWGLSNLDIIWNVTDKVFGIIFPFVLGACLAFVINMPMRFFERKISRIKNKKGKNLFGKGTIKLISLFLAIIIIILIFSLIIELIVPELINVIMLLIDRMPYYIDEIGKFLQNATQGMPDINTIIDDMNINVDQMKQQAIELITNFLTSSISVISNIVTGTVNFVIALIFAIYILLGKQKLKTQAKKILYAYLKKEKADKIIDVCRLSRSTFRKFIAGQCLEATILGVLCILGMLILRIPYAVPIGVLIGVTALIPVFGAFIRSNYWSNTNCVSRTNKGNNIYNIYNHLAASRRKFDLSKSYGKFSRNTWNMGTSCSNGWRKLIWNFRNVNRTSYCFNTLYYIKARHE